MNESFCKVPDEIVSWLLFSLFLLVLLSATALRTLVVLGVQLLWTSKLLKKKYETFDDARRMLIMTRVAPDCQDIGRLACLYRSTRLMRIVTKTKKST
jgi:hypothetical protein